MLNELYRINQILPKELNRSRQIRYCSPFVYIDNTNSKPPQTTSGNKRRPLRHKRIKQNEPIVIEYLADYPQFVPVAASWVFEFWGKMYRPKSVEKQIEKISGRLNKNRSPLSIEPENRYGSGKPGRNESQRTWSDNTVASHSKQKGPLCQTWMDVD